MFLIRLRIGVPFDTQRKGQTRSMVQERNQDPCPTSHILHIRIALE
jgi:hypothetical protein